MEYKRIIKNRKVFLLCVLLLVTTAAAYIYKQINAVSAEQAVSEYGEDALQENGLMSYREFQEQYAASYPGYLEKILTQNDDLTGISIFQKKDSFSFRNLEKTKADYKSLVGLKAEMGNFRALESVVSFETADYITFIFGVILVWSFFDDEKKGLWCVNYATPGGRMKLAMARCGVLLLGNSIFQTVLFFLLFGSAFLLYGGIEDIGCSVQSSPLFRDCILQVNVWEYLLLFVMLHLAAAFAMSLFVWMVLLFCRSHMLSTGLLLIVLAGECVFSNGLSDQSILVGLKYGNLFRLIHPGDILYNYRNFNLFSYPINCFRAYLCLMLVTIMLSIVISAWITSVRRPIATVGKIELRIAGLLKKINRVCHQGLSHLSVFGMEVYKILVMHKGILFLIVWIYLLVSQIDTRSIYYLGTGAVLKEIYSEYSGPDDGRLRAYIVRQEAVLQQEQLQYEKAVSAYEAGEISREEMENASMVYSSFSALEGGIESVNMQLGYMERIKEERGISAWFLSDKGYRILWTGDGLYQGQGYGKQEQRGLLAIIVLILLLSTVFSYDRTCGMEKLMRAAPYGREKLFYIKIRVAGLTCLFICLVTYGLELYEVQKLYPVSCLKAPVQSLDFMEHFPIVMAAGSFLLMVEMIHFLVLFMTAMAVFACTVYFRGIKGVAAALIILVFPAALQMLGFDWCQYISVLQPLVYVRILQEHGFVYSIISVIAMMVIGTVCYLLVKKRWCQNES